MLAGFELVSRTRCGILHAAPQSRDRHEHRAWYGPGSAAHHAAKRRRAALRPGHLAASCAGLTRLRGRSPFGAAKARASIALHKSLSKRMDCRVKPGNDVLTPECP